MKTYNLKPAELKKQWVVVDAADKPLGRTASEIARILRGKNKPFFAPNQDCGDGVIVINADKAVLTGNKWTQKYYYRYSGYIGGLKETRADKLFEKYPDRLITFAVKGMLPKNKLSRKLMTHLRVYAGESHPHEAQQPGVAAPRLNMGAQA